MATIFISQDELNDFEDEQPTQPMLLMTVQKQINSSSSVAAFIARGQELQREAETVKQHWTERLGKALDSYQVNMGPGWAGRVAHK